MASVHSATTLHISGTRLEALLDVFDELRISRGVGVSAGRLTPSQRADVTQICMSLYASKLVGEDGQSLDFWKSYLNPLLADSHESTDILEAALEKLLRTPQNDPIGQISISGASSGTGDGGAGNKLFRNYLWLLPLLLLAIGASFYFYTYMPAPPEEPVASETNRSAPSIPEARRKQTAGNLNIPEDKIESSRPTSPFTDDIEKCKSFSRDATELTPRLIAQMFAARYPQLGSPSVLLSAMLRKHPAPADAPLRSAGLRENYCALATYAATHLHPGQFPVELKPSEELENLSRAKNESNRQHWSGAWSLVCFLVILPALAYGVFSHRRWRARGDLEARRAEYALRRAELTDKGYAGHLILQESEPPPNAYLREAARVLFGAREPMPGRTLDAERSIHRLLVSTRSHVVAMRPASRSVDMIFLLLRKNKHDHEYARVARMGSALRAQGVNLEIYDYSPDPRQLCAPSGQRLNLQSLAERHPSAILILCTNGEELLNLYRNEARADIAKDLARWPRRTLLTPVPAGEWGTGERLMSETMGMPVLRSTPHGLLRLRQYAQLDGEIGSERALRSVDHWSARRAEGFRQETLPMRPDILRWDAGRFLVDHDPGRDLREVLLEALQDWLGADGFLWFASVAQYPQLQVEITLWLGHRLRRYGHVKNPTIFTEELFAQLCLLPWFSQGNMPDWLRRAAFEQLSPMEKSHARELLLNLLNDGDSKSLHEARKNPIWRSSPQGDTPPPDGVLLDCLFPEPARNSPRFQKMARRSRLGAIGSESLPHLGLALLWSLGGYLLFPDFVSAPLTDAAWFPLALYVLIGGILTLAIYVYTAESSFKPMSFDILLRRKPS